MTCYVGCVLSLKEFLVTHPVDPQPGEVVALLVDQPTAAPTSKIQAVAWTSLIAPIVAGVVVTAFPTLTAACGQELGLAATVIGVGLAQGALTTFVGYMKRNSVKVPA